MTAAADHSRDPISPISNRPRMSAAAIVAIVLAAIPFCPFLSLAGSLVGLIALAGIRRTGRRGRSLALAAIFLGGAQAIIWSLLGQYLATTMQEAEQAQAAAIVEKFIASAAAADVPAARLALTASASEATSDDALMAFGSAVRDSFGPFHHVRINSMSPVGGVFDQRCDVALVVHFESTSTTAAVRLIPRGALLSLIPAFQIDRVIIDRHGGADLEVPPKPATSPAGVTPAPPPSQ